MICVSDTWSKWVADLSWEDDQQQTDRIGLWDAERGGGPREGLGATDLNEDAQDSQALRPLEQPHSGFLDSES